MQKILTFSRNACAISPNDWSKICGLKNASRTAGQPADVTTAMMTSAAKTTVLASAIATPRAP
jgi:hypothetical protein